MFRFRLDIRKKFFYEEGGETLAQVVEREVAGAPFLETFKVRLDGALRQLVLLKMSLLIAEGLD